MKSTSPIGVVRRSRLPLGFRNRNEDTPPYQVAEPYPHRFNARNGIRDLGLRLSARSLTLLRLLATEALPAAWK